MSIQNFPRVSVDTSKFDLPVFAPAVAPVRIPTKTYDLVVSLGTDVHTFDRLLRWVEAYLEAHPEVTCLVQHGHTAPIKHADNLKLLPASELLDYYATARVVLVQGGPGSIQDARRTGALPLAVPRRAEFDEVVDNHQVPFTALMEKRGHAVVVESCEDLFAKLDLALANPSLFRTAEPYISTPEISAAQLGEELQDLLAGKTHRKDSFWGRLKQAARAHRAGKAEMARIDAMDPSA